MKRLFILSVWGLLFIISAVGCADDKQQLAATVQSESRTVVEAVGEPSTTATKISSTSSLTPQPTSTIAPPTPTASPQPLPHQEATELSEYGDYHIGLAEDIETLNPWQVYSQGFYQSEKAVLDGTVAKLYTEGPQRFDFVPFYAADLPPEPVAHSDGTYTIDVALLDGPQWSDGVPISAEDVAFTLNLCLTLRLDGDWNRHCQHDGLEKVEAIDSLTVRYTFNKLPNVTIWQYGVAQAHILPEHVWGEVAAEALSLIEAVEVPEACTDENFACDLLEDAREGLFSAEILPHPSAGGYITTEYEPDESARRVRNDNYFFTGTTYTLTSDGQYKETWADGTTRTYYGDGSGEETLSFKSGPFSPNVVFTVYNKLQQAADDLSNNKINYIYYRWLSFVAEPVIDNSQTIRIANRESSVAYFAFNLRHMPYSDLAFRQSISMLIDREWMYSEILNQRHYSADSIIWTYENDNDQIWETFLGLSADERFALAFDTLERAGYSWDTKPQIQKNEAQLLPDSSLIFTNGILGENSAIPSFNKQFEPTNSNLNFAPIDWRAVIFQDAAFDFYILAWDYQRAGVSDVDLLCTIFDSQNDGTLPNSEVPETRRNNSTGYTNPQIDLLCGRLTQTISLVENIQILDEMQQILAQDLPYIPLFHHQRIDYFSKNTIFPYTNVTDGIVGEFGMQTYVIVAP